MNNLQSKETDLVDEMEPQFSTTREKPDYYLGCFDTPELIEQAYKVIKATAGQFYRKNTYLFQSKGYTIEDLENEIHLKLLHKFKEQENPFWVDTLGNLKTISIFTLSKLIRNLMQERQPQTVSMSSYTQGAEDENAESNLEDVIFKDSLDTEDQIVTDIFYEDVLNHIKEVEEYGQKFSRIFKYSLYLNQNILLDLSEEEIRKLDKIKLEERTTLRSIVSMIEVEENPTAKSKKFREVERKYLAKMKDILEQDKYGIGINVTRFLEDQEDQKLILKGGSLEGKSKEDISRLIRKGGVIDKEKEKNGLLELIGHKDLAKKLTSIEKKKGTGITYKVLNGRVQKFDKPLTPQEKRHRSQLEYKEKQENLELGIKEKYELALQA